ncbi:HpcH/HpaI aldolase/citrate lyase family protein [Sediminivirga luteola]|uniref:CoA ester lyase n=1 Tax=Sediminivirga luteola TaxID=1774748 RepID=A0A8J2TUT0_9MICO|nr:CoA ester lyase [Sediminivirga luteola]GGA01753.1 CoA ester lyase [Sediminivirga luteola]
MTHPLVRRPGWLFCPADRPDRYGKAAERADVVILDLEDAVLPQDKPAAREALLASPLDPERTVVRINAADTGEQEADLEALRKTGYCYAMLAKTESAAQVEVLAGYEVIALIETAAGALRVEEIAAAEHIAGLMWGAEDLVASLGGTSSVFPGVPGVPGLRDVARYVRARTLIAAGAFGRFALDSVHPDIGDLDGLRAIAEDAVASGFDAKVSIHPAQVPVVREAYRPDPERLEWARGVLAAAQGAQGAFSYQGAMVDAPLLRQAEAVVARAEA